MTDVPQNLLEEIATLERLFTVDQKKLKEITDHFVDELAKGLSKEGGNIPMNPTWVMGFPTGDETGRFLALDMGGTNLRVCEIELLEEKGEFDIIQSKYRMPEELKTGTADELWEYVADCIQQFIDFHHEDEELETLPLGFTFSYPATQNYIDHGVLQRWTKGFDIDGVEGQDVVPQLEAALKSRVSHSEKLCPQTLIPTGTSHQARSSHQRHYRYHDRVCLHRSSHEDWLYLRHRLQCGIHGELWFDTEARAFEPATRLAHGNQLRIRSFRQ